MKKDKISINWLALKINDLSGYDINIIKDILGYMVSETKQELSEGRSVVLRWIWTLSRHDTIKKDLSYLNNNYKSNKYRIKFKCSPYFKTELNILHRKWLDIK